MSNIYSTYINPLDALVFDSIVESKPSDMETEANLALWANAQFTFDVKPGSGILDDDKPMPSTSSSPTISDNSSPSSITYESLANYLDYELPQQQQEQMNTQNLQQYASPVASTPRVQTQPLLLPRIVPAMTLEEITKVLLSSTNIGSTGMLPITSPNVAPIEVVNNAERAPAEEDKRKRNTAASARFRIKKKMREQSMEKTVREMTEKSSGLEDRVRELELEVKWLRGLLIEKTSSDPTDTLGSKNTTSIKDEL
ncbi:hypothetical protein INT47_010293 [Mucor saturninus]|uniref:BZIP domain-containing protein n=1 Tax=Mucor saturninus TaxID=64648 RepID=A0A8H7QUA0_9FUNG|nr:hypothetical protein INT47_010293 [Mucor saturninus]